jgi:hypothetical protein
VAGLVHLSYWVSSFIATKMFHFLLSSFGLTVIFLAITIICLGFVAFIIIVIPETRITKSKQETEHGFENMGVDNL